MYDPLTNAFNAILQRFRKSDIGSKLPKPSNLDIFYKVNDPGVITSSRLNQTRASKRKPDIITLKASVLKDFKDLVQRRMVGKPGSNLNGTGRN